MKLEILPQSTRERRPAGIHTACSKAGQTFEPEPNSSLFNSLTGEQLVFINCSYAWVTFKVTQYMLQCMTFTSILSPLLVYSYKVKAVAKYP